MYGLSLELVYSTLRTIKKLHLLRIKEYAEVDASIIKRCTPAKHTPTPDELSILVF
jgi:hypothetical protein